MTTQINQVLEHARTLRTFGTDDFVTITTDKHRLGGIFYILLHNGLIKKTGRGRYVINDDVIESVRTVRTSDAAKYSILYGLELEMEYNKNKIGKISKSGYHSTDSTRFNRYFIAESDSSLHREDFAYDDSDTCELVSIPMTRENVMKALQSLKDEMIKRYNHKTGNESCELNEIISFNQCTGAHVHMSLLVKNGTDTVISLRNDKNVKIHGETKNIMTFSNIKFMKIIAKKIKNQIHRELPEFYESFIKYYYRNFAKRMNANKKTNSRYNEFNTSNDVTVEYRSLHLRGIRTWNQLFKFYDIVTSVTDAEFHRQFTSDKPFMSESSHDIEIDTDDFNTFDVDADIDMDVYDGSDESINIDETIEEEVN